MSSQAIWLIARREIVTRVQQKGYRIAVLITLLVAIAAVLIPSFFSGGDDGPTRFDIAVTAPSPTLHRALTVAAADNGARVDVHTTDAAAARSGVKDGTYDAAMVGAQVVVDKTTDSVVDVVQAAAQLATSVDRLRHRGIATDAAFAALAHRPLPVHATSSGQDTQRQAFAIITVVVLFSQLVTFCTWVGTGVVEEKSSRVVELLLSSVRPMQLLVGKLIGIGTVAVTQIALLGGAVLITAVSAGTLTLPAADLLTVLISFIAFVLGYAFFASIAAALASTVSRQEELSGVLTPVTVAVTLCYLVAITSSSGSGDSTFYKVLSVVPPVSSIAMPGRIARGQASVLDVVLAAVLLIAGTALVLALAARIYRASILHTGTRVRLRQAWQGEAVATAK